MCLKSAYIDSSSGLKINSNLVVKLITQGTDQIFLGLWTKLNLQMKDLNVIITTSIK